MKAYRLFTAEEAAEIVAAIKTKDWYDGQASNQTTVTKRNQELSGSSVKRHLDELEKRVLEGPIPRFHFVESITPIKFNKYADGGEYGSHSDAAVQHGLRSDLACTLFLSDGYEGGELCVGGHEVKLEPGNVIVYECWRPHQVKPVTSGERIAAIWWMQSYIRSEEQRDLLGMLRGVIAETKDEQHFAKLGAIHEKLTKMWWS
jgi:PKHD-type hydroxylase